MEDLNDKNLSKGKKRKKSSKIKIAIICVVVLIVILGIGLLYGNTLLSKMKRSKIDESDLGIKKDVEEKIQTSEIRDIVNIAILGVDEAEGDVGRSDALMIATFDPVHKKLKITSIMRDTYVDIPGNGKDKINHAFAYGGSQLSIKTLNQNFGLNIKDYVKINFKELEGLVDAIGGIDMELSDKEIVEVDDYIVRVSKALNLPTNRLVKSESGKIHLDGFQTLGYCRIRSTDNGDFDRTERHRKIMTEMFNKISNAGTAQLASMATKLLPYVETSLSNKEILNLAGNVLNLGTKNIEQERFPRDEYCHDLRINGICYIGYDKDYTEQQVHEYIFNDRKMWLEPNQKVYIPEESPSDSSGGSNYENTNTETVTPNTNKQTEGSTSNTNTNINTNNNTNTTNNNNNNTNNNDVSNSSSESNQNNSNNGDKTQGEDKSTDTTVESSTKGTGDKPNP